MKSVRVGNFFGGLPIKQQQEQLKDEDKCPHIIVGTPGRVKAVRALLASSSVSCCTGTSCQLSGLGQPSLR